MQRPVHDVFTDQEGFLRSKTGPEIEFCMHVVHFFPSVRMLTMRRERCATGALFLWFLTSFVWAQRSLQDVCLEFAEKFAGLITHLLQEAGALDDLPRSQAIVFAVRGSRVCSADPNNMWLFLFVLHSFSGFLHPYPYHDGLEHECPERM